MHHDIWDFDAPSPTVLYDAQVDGKTVPAIAEAAKTGWLYVLDRCDRQAADPDRGAAGAAERVPEDVADAAVPDEPAVRQPGRARRRSSTNIKKQIDTINEKRDSSRSTVNARLDLHAAGARRGLVTAPDATGGTNWQPSSYNPKTNMIYVCSQDGVAGYSASDIPGFTEGKQFIGAIIAITGFGPNPGHLTAIDATTGEIKWVKDFPESCYSGSATTAGNVTFVGRNDGELEAYNATTGDLLWSFQTGAGANNVADHLRARRPRVRRVLRRRQQPGRHRRTATACGCSRLDGTMGPVAPGASAAAGEHAGRGGPREGGHRQRARRRG